jgi:hypothetical protein
MASGVSQFAIHNSPFAIRVEGSVRGRIDAKMEARRSSFVIENRSRVTRGNHSTKFASLFFDCGTVSIAENQSVVEIRREQ